ncbi:MAG: lysophospholipid acyltransferase family protein [Bacteroidota bacterium]
MRVLYAILHFFFYVLSLIPLRILYLLSDLLTFLIYHVFKYRRSVVMENLSIAFPEKSEQERKKIAKAFYSNVADSLVETFKMISASDRLIEKMFRFDPVMLEPFLKTDKKIQIHAMHNFNWEVVNLGISKNFKLPFLGVYQPLKNEFFEKLFSSIRARYGTVLIPATDFKNNFLPYQDKQYIIALVADQNPKRIAQAWWVDFFGKPTAFTQGPEKAARLSNNRIVFGTFFKLKRGVYSFSAEVITDDAASMMPVELTLKYVDFLDSCIRDRPDNYLWSHRRWKHPYNEAFASLRLISADR